MLIDAGFEPGIETDSHVKKKKMLIGAGFEPDIRLDSGFESQQIDQLHGPVEQAVN